MEVKEIPFRPKLEGEFRTRFYNMTNEISEVDKTESIIDLINKEIHWVEIICQYNLNQRKIYRAALYLLRDLINASWNCSFIDGCLYLAPADSDKFKGQDDYHEAKATLRAFMNDSRIERIKLASNSIISIENESSTTKSITSLIADGKVLANKLRDLKAGMISLNEAINPYLQLVEENKRDEFTNIKLSDIWRYFRMTWSSPYETTPGRTIQYLVRDASSPNHPIMGIFSLENCAVQITDRDNFIGWNAEEFIKKVSNSSLDEIRLEIKRLISFIDDGISSIDTRDLCNQEDLDNPSERIIAHLKELSVEAESKRQDSLRNEVDSENEKSDLGRISKETEDALYLRKRGDGLYKLLKAKRSIIDLIKSDFTLDKWNNFCLSENGLSTIRTALVAQKTKHIGSSMMELNVCGAIPPYNEVLGGKLVALLALSPQVIFDYKAKYSNKFSEIASRLKGEKVYRPADLVYVGTTSLYNIGSSQYNRLKIPGSIFNSEYDIKWQRIGMTQGFGSWHISRATSFCLSEVVNEDIRKINHVFGEGASPKLRLLSASIPKIFENGEESKYFSRHSMRRIVFGAMLAENTKEYLLGIDESPNYPFSIENSKEETEKIILFWQNRWLNKRLLWSPIYEIIESFDVKTLLLSQYLEDDNVQVTELKNSNFDLGENDNPNFDYIKLFYRGSSAYADKIKENFLSQIHIETKLDKAIIDNIKKGKDVILTGNPGDGKTHIIRVVQKKLGKNVIVELDASTKSNEQIFNAWKSAKDQKLPFLIAINAAVLLNLHREYPTYEPIDIAYNQMINSICIDADTEVDTSSVILFDLSKRNNLSKEVVIKAIDKLTSEEFFSKCTGCPLFKNCDVHKNRRLMRSEVFQERLCYIFERVTLQGYHATLRELQSFISYLIFADRDCEKIAKTNGIFEYDLANLVFKGKGSLFDKVRESFDPIRISHPILDEQILTNDILDNSWIEEFSPSRESITPENFILFELRKRQFYFFNRAGNKLISLLDDDISQFAKLISMNPSVKSVKGDLFSKINAFFSSSRNNNEMRVWTGHRYDMEPRKVLISTKTMKPKEFDVFRPYVNPNMCQGIDGYINYLIFRQKEHPNIKLKVDFPMFVLLQKSERGVPVLFLEQNLSSKVWRFMEQLHSLNDELDDEYTISLMDLQNKKIIDVMIDIDSDVIRYNTITKK